MKLQAEKIEEIVSTIMEARGLSSKQCEKNFDGKGCTLLQYATLKFIEEAKNPSVKNIADHLSISMSSTTQLVDRLMANKLICREEDTEDRRVTHLKLTEAGKEEVKEHKKLLYKDFTKIAEGLTEEDIKEFLRIQKVIIQNMHKFRFN